MNKKQLIKQLEQLANRLTHLEIAASDYSIKNLEVRERFEGVATGVTWSIEELYKVLNAAKTNKH